MQAADVQAAIVAFESGYASASQFNRGYTRLFGQRPVPDMRALRSPLNWPRLESIPSGQVS